MAATGYLCLPLTVAITSSRLDPAGGGGDRSSQLRYPGSAMTDGAQRENPRIAQGDRRVMATTRPIVSPSTSHSAG